MANNKIQLPTKAAKPAPLTEEEINRKKAEFFLQKRESYAMGILYNLCQNIHIADYDDTDKIVKKSVQMADQLLEQLFGVSLNKVEKKEE